MLDRRRYLGTFAVFALVLLRLVIGWHFFREGTKKVEYDRRNGELRLAANSEGFLKEAKGPLAGWYHAYAPDDHGFRELLAQQNTPPTAEELAERAKWSAEAEQRRAEAKKKGEPPLIEVSPSAPYFHWALQIARDWKHTLGQFEQVAGIKDDQKERASKALTSRWQQLVDYLASQSEAITEYQHELSRLKNWRSEPEAGKVPFYDQRIATKAGETSTQPAAWINQIHSLDADYHNDLRNVLTSEQRDQALTRMAVNKALADPREKRLHTVDLAVTVLTIGVGVCLLLGLFTRLASIAGAVFLLSVIGSQPPWLPDAAVTMPNVIECAALLVLVGTRAGRWAGLDYFTYALFNRRKG